MSDDNQHSLGTILGPERHRDAVHIAIAPVVAAVPLAPGEHIGILPDGRAGRCDKLLGIVDPFLPKHAEIGERFWLFLYPNSITSLRHVWSHPAFTFKPQVPE